MTGAKQFGLGVKTYGQAISFIFRNKLGWTFLVPVGLTILMFIGGQALVNEAIVFLQEEILGWVNLEESGFWGGLLGGVVGLLTEILFFIIFAYISGYIVIILMSPLLAYLSEKTEQILTGSEYSVGISQMIKRHRSRYFYGTSKPFHGVITVTFNVPGQFYSGSWMAWNHRSILYLGLFLWLFVY
jgi:CysZ protein